MAEDYTQRFQRLLALVPYLRARPEGVDKDEAAADLGVSRKELEKDIQLLILCGLPRGGPEDLIDIFDSEDWIEVQFTAGMDRPLRLTSTEASLLLVSLHALRDAPGVADTDAVARAISKIEAAVGENAPAIVAAERDDDTAAEETESAVAQRIRLALADRRALDLRYYTPGRDAVSDRVVDPIRLVSADNNSYLEAWCRKRAAVRLFRFDRIESAELLDEPATELSESVTRVRSTVFDDASALPVAEVEIDPSALWVFDYYLIEPVEPPAADDEPTTGPVRARLTYGSPEWLTRFLLGFGGLIRLVDDPRAAAEIAGTAAAARQRYR